MLIASTTKTKVNSHPETAEELTKLAEKLLRRAGAVDVLPTPFDDLLQVAKIREHEYPADEGNAFIRAVLNLPKSANDALHRALQKVRGMTNLRERAIYIARADTDREPRLRFVRGHELAHNVIPWQQFDWLHIDKEVDLKPETRRLFDREANFMSGELLYQGRRFLDRARSFSADLDSVYLLAQQHGASLQATLWRYVEVQDERILVAMYYPNKRIGVMELWKAVASPAFLHRFPDVAIPDPLDTQHPWRAAMDFNQDIDGEISLDCGSDGINKFRWQSRWNQHTLLVLVRRIPKLATIGRFLRAA